MDKLLNFLITQIVDQPEAVQITSTEDNGLTTFSVTVDPKDMGKIIGKGGKIINAIRELMKVKAIKTNQRIKVVLVEPETTQTDSLSPPIPSD